MSFLFGNGGGGGFFLSSISSGGSGGTAAAPGGGGGGAGSSSPTTASSGGRSSPSGASSSSLLSSFASGVAMCRNAALHGGILFLALVVDPIHRCGSSVTRSLFRRMTKSQRLWWSAFSKGAMSVLVGLVCYRIGRACVSHLISSPSSSSPSYNATASASQTRRTTDNDEEDHLFVDMRVSLFESFSRDVQELKCRIVERLKAVEEQQQQQQQQKQQQESNPGSTAAEEVKESPTKVHDGDVSAPEDTETAATVAAAAAATTFTSSSRKKAMEQDLIWIDEHITKLLIRIDEAPVAGLEELRSRRRRLLEEGLSLEAWLKRLSGAMGGL